MYFEPSAGSRHTISCIEMWRLLMIASMSLILTLISSGLSKSQKKDPEFESLVIRRDLTLPNIDVQNVITNGNAPVLQIERILGALVNLFSDREAEPLAFPFLFPDGINRYHTARHSSPSTLDYFQTRLLSSDLLHDSISVILRMHWSGGRARQRPVVNCLTAGHLRKVSDNPELSENCYAFLHNMRETIAYWQRAKFDLFAMFRTLGPPTFFITHSADDMNWPDLLTILAKQAGMEVTEETIAQLSTEQKRELLCNNPVTTAQHFTHRFQTSSSTFSRALEVQFGKWLTTFGGWRFSCVVLLTCIHCGG